MSFDRVIQIVPQYTQSTRVFGEKSSIRIEITHAEPCMSRDEGIRGSIEGSTRAETTWNFCEIATEIPQQLESDVYERTDLLNKGGSQSGEWVAQAAGGLRDLRSFVDAFGYNLVHCSDLLVLVFEFVSLLSKARAGNVKSLAPRTGECGDVALGAQSRQVSPSQRFAKAEQRRTLPSSSVGDMRCTLGLRALQA